MRMIWRCGGPAKDPRSEDEIKEFRCLQASARRRTGGLCITGHRERRCVRRRRGIDLRRPDNRRLPDWAPGAHIDLMLPSRATRQYSLCGDRWDAYSYRVGVLREPNGRGGSAFIHDWLEVGDIVGVGGPRNNFPLAPAPKYLFIAGGIGITPLIPMIAQAELMGIDWQLLYGGRTRSSMAFLGELAGYGDRVAVMPQDECGLLDLPTWLTAAAATETKVYVCGPEPLLNAVEMCCVNWPVGMLRMERFVPKEQCAPVRNERSTSNSPAAG